MGKRDHRLRSPEDFRRALRSRPVARSGPVALYKIDLDDGCRIGFVLPKKLVRSSVQRNQIKRWSRALFRDWLVRFAESDSHAQSLGLVVRIMQPLKKEWSRRELAAEVRLPLMQVFSRVVS
ncbi:MAG: ribonuclease P protein component [Burkholderiaceae bacterium]|nr:ribonuclease P protein component [Burkholderiaceae bacterium]